MRTSRPSVALPWGRGMRSSRAGPECVRLRLHPHSVRGQVPRAALERARLAVSGQRSALPKPQVTGVIGVSDPYRQFNLLRELPL
jgi:hypothetical protein